MVFTKQEINKEKFLMTPYVYTAQVQVPPRRTQRKFQI